MGKVLKKESRAVHLKLPQDCKSAGLQLKHCIVKDFKNKTNNKRQKKEIAKKKKKKKKGTSNVWRDGKKNPQELGRGG